MDRQTNKLWWRMAERVGADGDPASEREAGPKHVHTCACCIPTVRQGESKTLYKLEEKETELRGRAVCTRAHIHTHSRNDAQMQGKTE